jgi:cytochrome c oxidase assembly protein subunit 15
VRILGFVFLIPFIIFLIRKNINFYLIKRLGLVVFFTALTASAGWIMVKSGLVNRPWVNAYKLSLHFILAVLSISAMVKTIADVYNYKNNDTKPTIKFLGILIVITFIQLVFAGLMSGMKAGLYYQSWPDMNGHFIPEVLLNTANWNLKNLTNYDTFVFAPALVQFIHRLLAYALLLLSSYIYFKNRSQVYMLAKFWLSTSYLLVIIQLVLGILIVLNINSGIPLFYGVTHQLVGILFFISLLFLFFSLRRKLD